MSLALSLPETISAIGKLASDNPYMVLMGLLALVATLVKAFYTSIKDSLDRKADIADDYRQQYLDCRDDNKHLESKIEKLEQEIEKMDEEFRASRTQFISIISDLKSGYKVIRSEDQDEQKN